MSIDLYTVKPGYIEQIPSVLRGYAEGGGLFAFHPTGTDAWGYLQQVLDTCAPAACFKISFKALAGFCERVDAQSRNS